MRTIAVVSFFAKIEKCLVSCNFGLFLFTCRGKDGFNGHTTVCIQTKFPFSFEVLIEWSLVSLTGHYHNSQWDLRVIYLIIKT